MTTRAANRNVNGTAAPRRRSPWLRRLVILVVILGVALVGLDRGGDYVAERIAADNLQSSQHLGSRPDVQIDGVPFLTQFARGTYEHMTIDARDLPIADGALHLTSMHVDLDRLTVSRDYRTFHVGSATARAFIDYPELSKRLGVTVRYAGTHRITASKAVTLPVVGVVNPSISVTPVLINGALGFGTSAVNGAGDNLGAVTAVLAEIFDVSIPLGGIPFQMRVRSLTAGSTGVTLTLVGADLTFSKAN